MNISIPYSMPSIPPFHTRRSLALVEVFSVNGIQTTPQTSDSEFFDKMIWFHGGGAGKTDVYTNDLIDALNRARDADKALKDLVEAEAEANRTKTWIGGANRTKKIAAATNESKKAVDAARMATETLKAASDASKVTYINLSEDISVAA